VEAIPVVVLVVVNDAKPGELGGRLAPPRRAFGRRDAVGIALPCCETGITFTQTDTRGPVSARPKARWGKG
jgi:hypothetical protein